MQGTHANSRAAASTRFDDSRLSGRRTPAAKAATASPNGTAAATNAVAGDALGRGQTGTKESHGTGDRRKSELDRNSSRGRSEASKTAPNATMARSGKATAS